MLRLGLVIVGRTLDDLVEFATIQPDAAAFWAIVDLNTLSLSHRELTIVDRALHGYLLVLVRLRWVRFRWLQGIAAARSRPPPIGGSGVSSIIFIRVLSRGGMFVTAHDVCSRYCKQPMIAETVEILGKQVEQETVDRSRIAAFQAAS